MVKTCFRPTALFLRPRPAKLFKLQGSKAFQINVENNKLTWKPGQHAFLRFSSRLLDNHPFSISNLPDTEENELKFVVVPQRGLTKKLCDEIEKNSNTKILIDGPYGGCSRDHNSFDKVILAASGSGITATIPFLTDLTQNATKGTNTITKEIDFIWIVRKDEDIDWFKTELIKALECTQIQVNIDIYVCGGSANSEEKIQRSEDEKDTKLDSNTESMEELIGTTSNQLNTKYYKPRIEDVIIPLRHSLKRKNLIVSSGSESMKSAIAGVSSDFQSLIFNNDTNKSNIEEIFLHTESFHW